MTKILYKNKHKFFEWVNIVSKECTSDENILISYLTDLTNNYMRRNKKYFRIDKEYTWTGEPEEYYFRVDKLTDDENEYIIIDLSWF